MSWADTLHTELEGGRYVDVKNGWAECVDPARAEECALAWASEANRWMCDFVLPQTYPEGLTGVDVSGDYFEGAVPIVDELVAKAGWRLAGWLNMIAVGRTGLEEMGEGWVVDGFGGAQKVMTAGEKVEERGSRFDEFANSVRKTLRRGRGGWWGNEYQN